MISRLQRVSSRQLDDLVARGKILHSPFFTLRLVVTDGADRSRIAAVAPQKSFKTAVSRNRMRRRTYEALKILISKVKSGTIIGLFAKLPAQKVKNPELTSDLQTLFVKAGLLR